MAIKPKVTSLLKLDSDGKIENAGNNFHYWESHHLDKASVSKKLNVSFDKLHEIDVKMESFESVLEHIHVTPLVTLVGLRNSPGSSFWNYCDQSLYVARQTEKIRRYGASDQLATADVTARRADQRTTCVRHCS